MTANVNETRFTWTNTLLLWLIFVTTATYLGDTSPNSGFFDGILFVSLILLGLLLIVWVFGAAAAYSPGPEPTSDGE